MQNLIQGFKAFFSGIAFIQQHKLWKYIVFPSIISLIIGIFITFGVYASLSNWLLSLLDGVSKVSFSGFLGSIVNAILWLALLLGKTFIHLASFVIGAVISLSLYSILVSIFVDPFLGSLQAKVEQIILGKEVEISTKFELKNIIMGIWFSVKGIFRMLLWLLLSLLTGPLQPIIMTFVEGNALGRETFDLFLEKHSFTLEKRKQEVKKFRMQMTGLGIAKLLMVMSIVGAVFVPAASLTGAALTYYGESK